MEEDETISTYNSKIKHIANESFALKERMSECPNYIKKQSKSYYTTLSDDESDKEDGSDNKVNIFVAFTARNSIEDMVSPTLIDHPIENISDNEEDLTEEELISNNKMLFMK
ncbi:hypothetical protein LIER_02806 [Lithospermum erythrorhizon]|uniref:Uncharacterized protein n=1 Tax=Lithospermum erythrorhizon TaxID=34254 RepID=A0AAV3NS00_LITER